LKAKGFNGENKMTTISSYTTTEKIGPKPFFSSSIFVWLILVGYLALVKLVVLPFFPPIEIDSIAAIFSWGAIVSAGSIGLVGLWLADRTGFMPALDPSVSNRQRYWIPLLIGGVIGTVASLLDPITRGTQFIAENMGVASFNTDYPLSLFIYTSGTVVIEAIFRLFLFPVLLWLISYAVLKRRWQEQTFWVLILIFSFLEPLGQLSGQMTPKVMDNFGQFFVTMFLPMLLTNYPMGVAQAYLFRRYGFLASFMVRMGYYIIWHIVYGSLIYPLLNA
jgi:hypothetical protein